MFSLRVFGYEKIFAFSMNNYFLIKILNKSFKKFNKIFKRTSLKTTM